MKKFLSYIVMAGLAVLGVASCAQKEMVMFEPADGTAPVLTSYTMDDDGVYAEYTPGIFQMGFNEKIAPVHSLALVKVGSQAVSKTLVSKVAADKITVTRAELCKALMTYGYAENDVVDLSLVVRASMQDQAKDNGLNGYLDSQAAIDIAGYEIWLPTGDPYARYTEKSPWTLVGSFNGWGSDPDVEMLTNGSLHLAKGVTLAKGDEVKFRKDGGWDVNFGYAEGVESYVLGEEFDVAQNGGNIVIAEDGVYDLILDADGAKAKILQSVAPQEDPYAAYTEVSPWSVIGSFNSWAGDEEMVTNGTLHVCKDITLAAGDEFKVRKDAGWDVNFGYADGVETYELGTAFDLKQDGANIKVLEDGAYDIILDPENATMKIIKTQAVSIDPYAAYTEESAWSVIGSFNSWADDYPMVTNGTLHVAKKIALAAGEEWKFRFEGGWTVNFGYADGVDTYELGTAFELKQDGANIKVLEDGEYDFILDPENATATVIKSIAVDGGEQPGTDPQPKPGVWSLIGTIGGSNWDTDLDLTKVTGDIWQVKNVAISATDEFKIRADHDWAISVGGSEANSQSTIDPENPYDVYKPVLGIAFAAGSLNIQIGVEGNYNVTFDYAAQTILIEEYREFPEHLYMIGEEFGAWDWNSDGIVELIPVLHKPEWGSNAEGQFYTVRYFNAGKGFKFCAQRAWNGDFYSLETNDGYTVSDNNCYVAESGFYMVHIDFKNGKLHVEPAKVYGIGDAFGGWTEAVADNLFVADEQTLTATAKSAGNLRMYAASDISTSPWWSREFNIIEGEIVYRLMDELAAPAVLGEQVIVLDFNAGEGEIEGEGVGPTYKNVLSVPGDWAGSQWDADAPKLSGDEKGKFAGPLVMSGQSIQFKFIHDGSWIGGTSAGDLSYTLGANDNMTIDAGIYWWNVDLVNNTATAVPITKVGIIGSFNSWSEDVVLEQTEDLFVGSVELEANASFKIRFNGDWSYALGGSLEALSAFGGDIKVEEGGMYNIKFAPNAGTLELTPSN